MAKVKAKPKAGPKPARRAKYSWRAGYHSQVPAPVAAAALNRLRSAGGGGLTPEAVVEAARDPASPLHAAFTWDDTAAADAYRKQEARQLINSVRVTYATAEPPKLAFVSVNYRDTGERAYLPIDVVVSDADYRAQAIQQAAGYLEGLQRRFRDLDELGEVFAAAERFRAKYVPPKEAASRVA
jgi:hypothetical protein